MNRKASIWKHVRLANAKWRYCRPVLHSKGKIVPNMVRVNSHEEHHPGGEYCICYYSPKLTWQKCGSKPADALASVHDRGRPPCWGRRSPSAIGRRTSSIWCWTI